MDLRPFLDQFTQRAGAQDRGTGSNNALGLALKKPVVITETRLESAFKPNAQLINVGLALVLGDDGLRGMSMNATAPSLEGTGQGR